MPKRNSNKFLLKHHQLCLLVLCMLLLHTTAVNGDDSAVFVPVVRPVDLPEGQALIENTIPADVALVTRPLKEAKDAIYDSVKTEPSNNGGEQDAQGEKNIIPVHTILYNKIQFIVPVEPSNTSLEFEAVANHSTAETHESNALVEAVVDILNRFSHHSDASKRYNRTNPVQPDSNNTAEDNMSSVERTVATIDSNYTETGVPLSLNALRASSQKVGSNHKNHASPQKTHRLLVPQRRMQKLPRKF